MKNLKIPIILVALMWLVFILDNMGFNLNQYGIYPRTLRGLIGIVCSPFLHADWGHIVSNTIPMFILSATLFVFYPKLAGKVLIFSALLGGILVWIFARSAMHVGASGLIFSLVGFLLASGIFRKKFKALLIAIIIFFIYGGIIWGVLPTNPRVSFEGHLFGLIAGVFEKCLRKK